MPKTSFFPHFDHDDDTSPFGSATDIFEGVLWVVTKEKEDEMVETLKSSYAFRMEVGIRFSLVRSTK
jgi:hypothetical protein